MIDTVIVSGGMIQKDFALDFIKKLKKEIYKNYLFFYKKSKKIYNIAY